MKPGFILSIGLLIMIGSGAMAADHPSKKLYDTKCASCHGKDLKGNAAMAKAFKIEASALDLTTEAARKKTDEEFIRVTAKGVGKMPAYEKTLKPAEITGLVEYIRSVAPKIEVGENAKPKIDTQK